MSKNIAVLDILGGVAGHIARLATEMDARQRLVSTAESDSVPVPADADKDTQSDDSPVPDTDLGKKTSEDINSSAQCSDTPMLSEKSAKTESSIASSRQSFELDETASPLPRLWLLGISALILLLLICLATSQRIKKKNRH